MIEIINFSQFCDGFPDTYKNNFSYQGKKALFNYFESYEDDAGEPVQYDPIAFCCEYTEYENLAELQKNYNDIETMEDLENHTTVIKIENSDGFIIANY